MVSWFGNCSFADYPTRFCALSVMWSKLVSKFNWRYSSDFLNWGIIMPVMRLSTNEYPKTENYYPHWSLEIQISQRMFSFPLFLHKILSTANVTWNSVAFLYGWTNVKVWRNWRTKQLKYLYNQVKTNWKLCCRAWHMLPNIPQHRQQKLTVKIVQIFEDPAD